MATEAQISANRQNAEKSTGPRTDEGKAVVSQNAVKHGLFAIKTVVNGEDQALFDLRREAMLGEMRPIDHYIRKTTAPFLRGSEERFNVPELEFALGRIARHD